MKKFSQYKGFTLVELMIVIAIIGILAVAVLPQVFGTQENARDSARQSALRNIQSSIFQYYSDTSNFPGAGATATAGTSGAGAGTGTTPTCLSDLQTELKSHASSLPTDPKPTGYGVAGCESKGGYGYKYLASGNYIVSAKMERQTNANFNKEGQNGDDSGNAKVNSVKYDALNDIEEVQPQINKKNILKDTTKANWYFVIGQ